jgi:formylmethanofuran dehydrogenase subunit A
MLNIEKDWVTAYPRTFGIQVTNEEGAEAWIEISANVEARTFDVSVDMNAGLTPKQIQEALKIVREGVLDGSIVLPLQILLWEVENPDDQMSVTEMLQMPADA